MTGPSMNSYIVLPWFISLCKKDMKISYDNQ